MPKELTINETIQRLGERGITAARRTVNAWIQQDLFKGARLEKTPLGEYWLIPQNEVDSFKPPKMGRPPKEKSASKKSAKKKT